MFINNLNLYHLNYLLPFDTIINYIKLEKKIGNFEEKNTKLQEEMQNNKIQSKNTI